MIFDILLPFFKIIDSITHQYLEKGCVEIGRDCKFLVFLHLVIDSNNQSNLVTRSILYM